MKWIDVSFPVVFVARTTIIEMGWQGREPMVHHMMSLTGENCAFSVSILLLMFPEESSLVLGDCREKKRKTNSVSSHFSINPSRFPCCYDCYWCCKVVLFGTGLPPRRISPIYFENLTGKNSGKKEHHLCRRFLIRDYPNSSIRIPS